MSTPTVTTRVGSFRAHGYTVQATCSCGHARALPADWLVKRFGEDYHMGRRQLEELSEILRCSACQKKGRARCEIGKF